MRFLYSLVCALGVITATPSNVRTAIVLQHNIYRGRHHDTPPLVSDEALDRVAQAWADKLQKTGNLAHGMLRGPKGERLGQNVAWSSSPTWNATQGVDAWYNEIVHYDWSSPVFRPTTGHFTQVVWKASTRVGVGVSQGSKGTYVVVDYSPPGNVQGRFRTNVLRLFDGA